MYGAVDLPSSALYVVADLAFVRLFFFLEPEYKIPSHMQQACLLVNQHQRAKEEMKYLLRVQATVGVVLTNDAMGQLRVRPNRLRRTQLTF